jgi:hypothetical protein
LLASFDAVSTYLCLSAALRRLVVTSSYWFVATTVVGCAKIRNRSGSRKALDVGVTAQPQLDWRHLERRVLADQRDQRVDVVAQEGQDVATE